MYENNDLHEHRDIFALRLGRYLAKHRTPDTIFERCAETSDIGCHTKARVLAQGTIHQKHVDAGTKLVQVRTNRILALFVGKDQVARLVERRIDPIAIIGVKSGPQFA